MNATSPLSAAVDRAPQRAGVYYFLDAERELLYVGMASDLRARLRQHARAKPRPGELRLEILYQRVNEVRWEVLGDDDAAAAREADLIVALRPVFNASHTGEGRWNYIVVEPVDATSETLRFALSERPAPERGHVYGCFPHLGRGVSSRPAIACSDGYTALLRLLWASGVGAPRVPARITRSAPDRFDTRVRASMRGSLHAFLSGTSRRLLTDLAESDSPLEPYLKPGLARDRRLAETFFTYGPQALRRLRLRHRLHSGPMSKAVIEQLLAADLCSTIGEFRVPPPADPRDDALGRHAHRWLKAESSRETGR